METRLNIRVFSLAILSLLMLSVTAICGAEPTQKIQVESLSKPRCALPELSRDEILRKLIVNNLDTLQYIESYTPKILAHSELPAHMVNLGYSSLFWGMFEAYADHRPFAISPDVMWLLICQGFSHHVAANSEALRGRLVDFDEQQELVVTTDKEPMQEDWSSFIGDFSALVADNTKGNVVELLEADFSTTTPDDRIASQATILNSMKSYFRYTVIRIMCGIPQIELYGTVEDWQDIIRRTKRLSEYDLEWWTAELIPILEEISRSAAGDVDKLFWRDMFKYHTKKVYGNPKYADGWIVKFYPYLSDGERSNLKEVSIGSLPDEVVRVPIKYIDETSGKSYGLELCAGIFGLEQTPKTHLLTPKIGWYLHELQRADEVEVKSHYGNLDIDLNDSYQLPLSLFSVESIDSLTLRSYWFALEIDSEKIEAKNKNEKHEGEEEHITVGYVSDRGIIPQRLGDIKIKKLTLIGTVVADNSFKPLSEDELKAWFKRYMPDCEITIRKK